MHCSSFSGPIKEPISTSTVPEKKSVEQSIHITSKAQRDYGATHNYQPDYVVANVRLSLVLEIDDWVVFLFFWLILKMELQYVSTSSSRKPKVKKKSSDDFSSSVGPDPAELQGWFFWFSAFSIVFNCFLISLVYNIYVNILLHIFVQMPPLETFVSCWRTSVVELKFLVMIGMKQSG